MTQESKCKDIVGNAKSIDITQGLHLSPSSVRLSLSFLVQDSITRIISEVSDMYIPFPLQLSIFQVSVLIYPHLNSFSASFEFKFHWISHFYLYPAVPFLFILHPTKLHDLVFQWIL